MLAAAAFWNGVGEHATISEIIIYCNLKNFLSVLIIDRKSIQLLVESILIVCKNIFLSCSTLLNLLIDPSLIFITIQLYSTENIRVKCRPIFDSLLSSCIIFYLKLSQFKSLQTIFNANYTNLPSLEFVKFVEFVGIFLSWKMTLIYFRSHLIWYFVFFTILWHKYVGLRLIYITWSVIVKISM